MKPSGTALSGLAPDCFLALDRARLRELFALQMPDDSAAREALVQKAMARALLPGQVGRPSVETPLHESLAATYVVHTHAVLVNGMTCARNGAGACARLFPEALWVPYIDPGYTLSVAVNRLIGAYRAAHGREPNLILLENHGVVVAGDTPAAVRAVYEHVLDRLGAWYAQAGIETKLRMCEAPAPKVREASAQVLGRVLGAEGTALSWSPPFTLAAGPLTPDHIVYSRSFPLCGEPSAEQVARYIAAHGFPPRVLDTPGGVFGAGSTPRVAGLALDLALDGALVAQLAPAFGGVQYLTTSARRFIETWEVEAYRAQQMT